MASHRFSIEGHDVKGNPLKGTYLGSDRAMADGFAANAAYLFDSLFMYFTQSAPELYSGPYCAYHEKPMSEKPYFIECETNGGLDTGFGWIPQIYYAREKHNGHKAHKNHLLRRTV